VFAMHLGFSQHIKSNFEHSSFNLFALKSFVMLYFHRSSIQLPCGLLPVRQTKPEPDLPVLSENKVLSASSGAPPCVASAYAHLANLLDRDDQQRHLVRSRRKLLTFFRRLAARVPHLQGVDR
jgi:hypothetical protein